MTIRHLPNTMARALLGFILVLGIGLGSNLTGHPQDRGDDNGRGRNWERYGNYGALPNCAKPLSMPAITKALRKAGRTARVIVEPTTANSALIKEPPKTTAHISGIVNYTAATSVKPLSMATEAITILKQTMIVTIATEIGSTASKIAATVTGMATATLAALHSCAKLH